MLSLFFAAALPFLAARDVSYGPDPQQRFDVYAKHGLHNAPVIVMVHGGGWRLGDKSARNVVENKVAHFVPLGYVFISVDNRLLPVANPARQADDVARALAAVRARAREWGGDPNRIVLMGHSAGAHLVALVATQHNDILGTVLLDSGALDVPRIMNSRHFRLYDDAFGSDPAFWRSVSPYHQLQRKAQPFLAVCSTRRLMSCSEASAFVAKAKSLGGRAQLLEQNMTHEQINELLGTEPRYTAAVDEFLASVGATPR